MTKKKQFKCIELRKDEQKEYAERRNVISKRELLKQQLIIELTTIIERKQLLSYKPKLRRGVGRPKKCIHDQQKKERKKEVEETQDHFIKELKSKGKD